MTPKELSDIRRKLKVLNYATEIGNAAAACRRFGISGETFYKWKRAYARDGERALINSKPCPQNPKLRTPVHIEEKILYPRRTYHLGQQPIAWYLLRYHDIKISPGAVYNVLKRNGLNRLPQNAQRSQRVQLRQRYEKKAPGHHIQVDVKFLNFTDTSGQRVRRYQHTAIDDATRSRALKVYERHNQENAISFVNYFVGKFPFRIHTIRADHGHEFQSKFHWHVEDLGINHTYIRVRTPRLNGKVERSHRTDKEEFYQLLS
jgi:transposase InsO family protein